MVQDLLGREALAGVVTKEDLLSLLQGAGMDAVRNRIKTVSSGIVGVAIGGNAPVRVSVTRGAAHLQATVEPSAASMMTTEEAAYRKRQATGWVATSKLLQPVPSHSHRWHLRGRGRSQPHTCVSRSGLSCPEYRSSMLGSVRGC